MKYENKKIGVIIPYYNMSKFIKATLDSLEFQSVAYHAYIIDDGSEEIESSKLIKIASQYQNVTIHLKKNGGLSSARNYGLKLLREKYVLFLDSDDLLGYQQLDKQVSLIEAQQADICITKYSISTENLGNIKPQPSYNGEALNTLFIAKYWERGLTIPIHTALFKTDELKEMLFDESLKSKEDLFFWLNFFVKERKIAFLNEYCAIYRIVPKSMSRDPLLSEKHIYRVAELLKKSSINQEVISKIYANIRINYGLWKSF